RVPGTTLKRGEKPLISRPISGSRRPRTARSSAGPRVKLRRRIIRRLRSGLRPGRRSIAEPLLRPVEHVLGTAADPPVQLVRPPGIVRPPFRPQIGQFVEEQVPAPAAGRPAVDPA